MIKRLSIEIFSICVLFALIGCGSAAPKPTAAPTLAPITVIVVVTATPPPASPTLEATATLSPTPTTVITGTQTLVVQRSTSTPGAPGTSRATATATRRPATTGTTTAAATPTPFPTKYPAPLSLLRPNFVGTGQGEQRDERHYPSDSLVFEWVSPGALGGGECYLIRVDMTGVNVNIGDAFLQCDSNETTKPQSQTARFTLNKPTGPGPTYIALIPSGGGDLTVSWYVTIVKDDGPGATPGTGAYVADGTRHKVIPLGPKSSVFQFPLKGGAQ